MFVTGVNESTWLIRHESTNLLNTGILHRPDTVQTNREKTCERGVCDCACARYRNH